MDAGKLILAATAVMVTLGVLTVGFVIVGGELLSGQPDAVSDLDDEEDLPDGVTKDGVQDPQAAAAAHEASLSDVSYTLELRGETDVENGDSFTLDQTVRSDGQGTILISAERTGPGAFSIEIWTNGSAGYRKIDRGDDPIYETTDSGAVSDRAAATTTIQQLLDAGNFQPTDVRTEDGEQLVVLTTNSPADDAADALGVESVSSFSGNVTVDSDGQVHSMDVEFTATDARSGQFTQRLSGEVTDVGSTTVERPEWVSEATAQTGGGVGLVAPGQRVPA